MKTILNSKLAIAGLAIISFIFLSSFYKNETPGGFLTVRTFEVSNGIWDSKIIIINENDKVQEIELEKFRNSTITPNSIKIHQTLNSIIKQGYSLVSNTGGTGDAVVYNTYIFTKK